METLPGRIPVYGMYAGNTAPGTAAQEQKRTQKTPPLAAPDNAAKQQNPIQQSAAAQSGFQAIPAALPLKSRRTTANISDKRIKL